MLKKDLDLKYKAARALAAVFLKQLSPVPEVTLDVLQAEVDRLIEVIIENKQLWTK